MRILESIDPKGRSPFKRWFDGLDSQAASKVTIALTRIGLGNPSNVKSVDGGILEYRIDVGPGYRIYFGRDGGELVILLAGGTKRRQSDDIAAARDRWAITSGGSNRRRLNGADTQLQGNGQIACRARSEISRGAAHRRG